MRVTYINRENATQEELRAAHRCEEDRVTARRVFGMMKLYEGRSVAEVAGILEVSESSVQRWIKVFNDFGLEGLLARGKPGRKKSITISCFDELVLPLLEDENQEHWTAVKLHTVVSDQHGMMCSYRTLLRSLHEHGYSRIIPRPQHPDRDEEERATFLTKLEQLDSEPETCIYFCDEAGFEGDPRPRTKWVRRGTRPSCQRTGCHVRTSVIGAVNPIDGEFISLIVPQTDTQVFQIFLDEFAKSTYSKFENGNKVVLIMDNASWHKSKKLTWHHIQPVFLPPYSPDLNPIERLWREIKSNRLGNWFTKDERTLIEKLYHILTSMMKEREKVASITSYSALIK